MRATDDRYAGEQARFHLAMRLIGHQARTHIINFCTGFSQDRIRKIYNTYFKHHAAEPVRRHRGKSPSSTEFFLRNPWTQAEATVLAHLFAAWGLLHIQPDLATSAVTVGDRLRFGQRLCNAYEEFRAAHPASGISFEHAWSLLGALTERGELVLLDCKRCDSLYVQDALALDGRRCPTCRVTPRARASPAAARLQPQGA